MAISGGALWTQYVFPFLTQFPVNVGNTIISEFGGGGNAGGIATAFAGIADTAFDNISLALGSYGLSNIVSREGAFVLVMALVAVAAILLMVVIALALLISSKVLLAILIAIFPVLAVWAYLKSTAEIFNGWVRGITMLILFQILLFGVMGIAIAVSEDVSDNISTGISAGVEIPLEMFKLAGMSGITAGLLLICPMIAQRIGGAAISLGESQMKGAGATGLKLLGGQLTGGGAGGNSLNETSTQRASASSEARGPSPADAHRRRIENTMKRGADRMAEDSRRPKS